MLTENGKQGIYLTFILKYDNYVLRVIKTPLHDRFSLKYIETRQTIEKQKQNVTEKQERTDQRKSVSMLTHK